jgi:hypothetical protein
LPSECRTGQPCAWPFPIRRALHPADRASASATGGRFSEQIPQGRETAGACLGGDRHQGDDERDVGGDEDRQGGFGDEHHGDEDRGGYAGER